MKTSSSLKSTVEFFLRDLTVFIIVNVSHYSSLLTLEDLDTHISETFKEFNLSKIAVFVLVASFDKLFAVFQGIGKFHCTGLNFL